MAKATEQRRSKADPAAPEPQRRPQAGDMDEFMERVGEGASLRAACQAMGLHAPSTHTFINADPLLREQYMCARAIRGDDYGEKIGNVAAGVLTGRIKPDAGRVAIDAYKWISARMAPKDWSDRAARGQDDGVGDQPASAAAMAAEIRSLVSAADAET